MLWYAGSCGVLNVLCEGFCWRNSDRRKWQNVKYSFAFSGLLVLYKDGGVTQDEGNSKKGWKCRKYT